VTSWGKFTEADLGVVMQIINKPVKGLTRGAPVRLLVLGTGKEMNSLESKLKAPGVYMSFGVGFEVLSTPLACSTYNLLVEEGRHVVAALLPANG